MSHGRHYVATQNLPRGGERLVYADTTAVDRIRQIRGLHRHVPPLLPSRDRLLAVQGTTWKAITRSIPVHVRQCSWCDQPLTGRPRRWHPACLQALAAARGQTKYPNRSLQLLERGPCEQCDADGQEVDHVLSLAVARELGPRAELRARDVGNLRWLCDDCHKDKTREDRGQLARLRRGEPPQLAMALP